MRRIARILGLLGGLGAIVWAMRDRLVSVALPREPQVPTFRVPESRTTEEDSTEEDSSEESATSVTNVSGIGPVYATRLAAAGINSIIDLAEAAPEAVAEAAQVPISKASSWVTAAQAPSDQPSRP